MSLKYHFPHRSALKARISKSLETPRTYLALVLCGLLTAVSAHAIPEKDFAEEYQNKVLPYFLQGKSGTFIADDGVSIAYRSFENEQESGALVILPGCGIPLIGYAEVIYDLRKLGLSIYVMDHRGQKVISENQLFQAGGLTSLKRGKRYCDQ